MSPSTLDAAFTFASHADWARVVPAARQALAGDPENAIGHALLSLALAHLEQGKDAVESGKRAVALDPELAFAHYALGWAFLEHGESSGAERAAKEALRLDPDSDSYALLASVKARQHRWNDVLENVAKGLELNPEHAGCANLRAMALASLGRGDEAEAAVRGVLALDADDATAHANRGWLLLRQSDPEGALESFRAALRLDPSFDWARTGIVEALKARSGIYRLILRGSLWMGSLTARAQWMVLIGFFVFGRIVRALMRENPTWSPVLGPILGLYVLFVLMTWVADPLSNLLLRINPFGRLALRPHEILASNFVGACVALALVAILVFAGTRADAWLIVAASSAVMLIPIGGASKAYRTRAWWPLVAAAAVLGAFAVAAAVFAFSRPDFAGGALGLLLVGAFLFSWLANILMTSSR
jgi:Flp pilus assembly protein TadD